MAGENTKRDIAIQAYGILLVGLAILRLGEKISTDTGGFASRYLPLLCSLVLMVACLGYVRKQPLMARWFWVVMFLLMASASVIIWLFAISLVMAGDTSYAWVIFALGTVLVPANVLLWQYAFRSEIIWREQ